MATMLVVALLAGSLVAAAVLNRSASAATDLPSGFTESTVFAGLDRPTSFSIASDGRVFVTEKSGIVKVFADMTATTPAIFADLRVATYNQWDRGMLGIVADPALHTGRPYVYVAYSYDHQLGDPNPAPRWGSANPAASTDDPCPNPPGANANGCVSSARVSRLTVSDNGNGNTMSSETVLVEDWCQQFPSHTIGSLHFGPDGSLYAAGGDGAAFGAVDYGQFGAPQVNPCGDPPGGVGGTMTPPTAQGGTLRSQSMRRAAGTPVSLDGTIIRINPDTGAGVSSNPEASSNDANRRRVVAYGFKNPYRWTFRPGTDEMWVGDVGLDAWEEVNRVQSPQILSNYGFPCYEGAQPKAVYQATGLAMCDQLYSDHTAIAPYYAYPHTMDVAGGDGGRCPPGAPVGGPINSSITGTSFYEQGSYPAKYRGALFFADFSRECIWAMLPGANGLPDPAHVETFAVGAATPVDIQTDPASGDLLYVDIYRTGSIRRISYTGAPGAYPPVARITTTPATGGPTPFSVTFDAATSTSPQDSALTYTWDFGDNSTGVGASIAHTYVHAGTFTATLTATDAQGLSATSKVNITAGGPTPLIDSPDVSLTYSAGSTIAFSGHATDSDGNALPASALSWQFTIQHCSAPGVCHGHDWGQFNGVTQGTVLGPDHELPSFMHIKLTATDSEGLTTTVTRDIQPKVASLTVASSPPGLTLGISTDGFAPAPVTRGVVEGTTTTVTAPAVAVMDGRLYRFNSWSDGGAATHIVEVSGNVTLTASYTQQASVNAGDLTGDNWNLNGEARMEGPELVLTQADDAMKSGSAFSNQLVGTALLQADYDVKIGPGGGADGMAFVIAKPSTSSQAIGAPGIGLGYLTIDGVAVTADTYQNDGEPSNNFVGIADGEANGHLNYLTTSTSVAPLTEGVHHFTVLLVAGKLTVRVDGQAIITNQAVNVGAAARVGFTAGTGGLTDRHAVSNASIVSTLPPSSDGVIPAPAAGGWSLNGAAALVGPVLNVTPAEPLTAGSAFWPHPVATKSLVASYDATIDSGNGADGLAFVIADPTTRPTALGGHGWGLGYSGLKGIAVTADVYKNTSEPSGNFVGIADGVKKDHLNYIATSTNVASLVGGTHHFDVVLVDGKMTVAVDGKVIIEDKKVTVPAQALVGFTGGTGGLWGRHGITNVRIATGAWPGIVPGLGAWTANGAAAIDEWAPNRATLTPAAPMLSGTVFYPVPVASTSLKLSYDMTSEGADGMAFVFAKPGNGAHQLGWPGWGTGYAGIDGTAVVADVYKNGADPFDSFVGIATGVDATGLHYTATSAHAVALAGTHHFDVTLKSGKLTVAVDGTVVLSKKSVTVPAKTLLGFVGATGGLFGQHVVTNVIVKTS